MLDIDRLTNSHLSEFMTLFDCIDDIYNWCIVFLLKLFIGSKWQKAIYTFISCFKFNYISLLFYGLILSSGAPRLARAVTQIKWCSFKRKRQECFF